MALPDSLTFTLQDVVDEVSPSADTRQACLSEAIESRFDPRYRGNRDRLSNFRNYGYSKSIGPESDALFTDGNCQFLDGTPDSEWFIQVTHRNSAVGRGDTLHAIRCQNDGNLTRSLLTYSLQKEVTDLLVISMDNILVTYRWNVGSTYYFRLDVFSFDEANGFVLRDFQQYATSVDTSYGYSRIAYWNGHIYMLLQNLSMGYTRRIEVYTINLSTGALGGPNSILTLPSGTVYDIYCQNNHLFVSVGPSTAYLYAYSLDETDGDPTYVSLIATTHLFTDIDGNKDDIIYGASTFGTSIISFNGSSFTVEDHQGITAGALKVSFSELNGGYHTVSPNYYILQRVDYTKNIVAQDSQVLEEDVTGGSDQEVFDGENCFCNLKYSYGVAAGFYDGLFDEYYYLFSYPIT